MRAGLIWTSLIWGAGVCRAGTLSDPAVEGWNVRVGTQTFAGLYQFTTNTLLVETAQAIAGMGSDVIKGYLGPDFPRQYHITLPGNVTNLLTLARDEPSCRRVLDMPFRHFVFWAYPFFNSEAGWVNGYTPAQRTNEYRQLYDLTCYLLTNYNNCGKSFYLGHWEGDWYLLPKFNTAANPSPAAVGGMIDWLNNRQQAIDDARRATAFSNVNVLGYAEVNRVLDARLGGANANQRAINRVVPFVTNLDCLSWSSYDGMDLGPSDLVATLDYMQSMLPTNKAAAIAGKRIWIGEYGWGGLSATRQEINSRLYIRKLLSWGPRFILFWEIYNNEPGNNFCLIDSNNVKVASYYLHQRFINGARLAGAQFKETHGRLPNDNELGSLLAPMLDQPLPAPVNLTVSNLGGVLLTASSATLSGSLAQGVYGDDAAWVRVFWGRRDGGASRAGWEGSLGLGVNSRFNPATFTVLLTNLAPETGYFFRFYATNSSGEAWAPASGLLTPWKARGPPGEGAGPAGAGPGL
jgi:hypothetical protein